MAATTIDDEEDDWMVIECIGSNLIQSLSDSVVLSEIFISTADILFWDLPFILTHDILKVRVNRARLIKHSSYFQSLLGGNFSESSSCSVSIHWSLETFLHILMFIHGCQMEITIYNFLPLCRASLYFGLESLVLDCRNWFSNIIAKKEISGLKLDKLIHFWEFSIEHAIDWISALCTSYVARNFMWALSCDAFVDLPFEFLVSCVKHPHLTVDSERHLCEALLAWIHENMEQWGCTGTVEDGSSDKLKQMTVITQGWTSILEEIRVNLLPLWFIMGKSRCCYVSRTAKQGISGIMNLLKGFSKNPNYMVGASDQIYMKIRLTEYSKKLDISGCPQITSSNILLSMLHQTSSVDPLLLEGIGRKSIDLDCPKWLLGLDTVSCKAVLEVDISKCSLLHLGAAWVCFQKSFPFLRSVRMAYFLDFETKRLYDLLENNSSVCEVDLTVDVSPLVSSNISILYSESVSRPALKKYFDVSSCCGRRTTVSNITKLTLEGRRDFSDLELLHIAEFCNSLCYLNITGCSSVTDVGIANSVLKCRKLHSIIATDTSFGRHSASALCSRVLDGECSEMVIKKKHIDLSSMYLEVLHIGGCKGVSETSIGDILSLGRMIKNLCLRDTFLVDHALYRFPGTCLERLDVSNTMISRDSLSYMLTKNPGLKYLEAKGCKKLCVDQIEHREDSLSSGPCDKLFSSLRQECKLEELVIGWGFSLFSLYPLRSSLRSLKALYVGLGGSLGPEGLALLCTLSPSLESVTLLFQVICETSILNLLGKLNNLHALSICYCIGDVSPSILKNSVLNLRKLKLERMTPWLTNDDLDLLTENCANLIELSLVGCMHLDEDSQQIIASGWPGLISLHLEDCGAVTAKGTAFLLNCKAMEDLLLRHNISTTMVNRSSLLRKDHGFKQPSLPGDAQFLSEIQNFISMGPGIQKNFIFDAATRLPMLRSISLDWCDASEGDFDLPNFADKYSLSNVKISRCKLQKCTLDFQYVEAKKRPVHKETLVLEWNSSSLQRTVVKERIT